MKKFGLLCLLVFLAASPVVHAANLQEIRDSGDFMLVYEPPQSSDFESIARLVREQGRFLELIDHLNENFALPVDIIVKFAEGEGPYYDPDSRIVVMNYDFLGQVAGLFEENDYAESEDDLEAAVLDVSEFVLYHEIGHALVHVLEIPVTGKEEDAVDALSAIIITVALEETDILSTAADFWGFMSDETDEFEEADFWDEHSLDVQRFYSILCWIYGSDPEKYRTLLKDEGVDEDRGAGCIEEFQRLKDSWMTLLDPFLKK